MNATDRKILEEFAARVRDLEPSARIWAYGSRVRGDAEESSDLDVCVVVPGKLDYERRQSIGHVAWEVSFAHEIFIQDVVFSDESFEHGPMSAHPLVKNILREGQAA